MGELRLVQIMGTGDKNVILLEEEYHAICTAKEGSDEDSSIHRFNFIIKTKSHYHFRAGDPMAVIFSYSWLKIITPFKVLSDSIWTQLILSDDFLSDDNEIEIINRERKLKDSEKLVIKYRIRNHYSLDEIVDTTKENVMTVFKLLQKRFEGYVRMPGIAVG